MKKSFTLMELLIVISIIVLLAIVILISLNPRGQINKSHDSKRKLELTQLSKVLEDYYNDKNCYPKPDEVCYDATGQTTCHICGNETSPPNFDNFSPYQNKLPCDPQHPSKKYLYQVDNISCPTWYRIYTDLSNSTDPAITEVGCSSGCGPAPDHPYNYGVSSPNIGLETGEGTTGGNYCSSYSSVYIILDSICNICGSYQECKAAYPAQTYYAPLPAGNPNCSVSCIPD